MYQGLPGHPAAFSAQSSAAEVIYLELTHSGYFPFPNQACASPEAGNTTGTTLFEAASASGLCSFSDHLHHPVCCFGETFFFQGSPLCWLTLLERLNLAVPMGCPALTPGMSLMSPNLHRCLGKCSSPLHWVCSGQDHFPDLLLHGVGEGKLEFRGADSSSGNHI